MDPVDRALPASWPIDLARQLAAEWRTLVRGEAAPATIRRLAPELERRIIARIGDAEAPRTRLRALANRLGRAGTSAAEIRRALDAETERLLTPIAKRCDRDGVELTQQLGAEHALVPEARVLHRHVNRWKWEDAGAARRVIENEACAIGTALLVYWLGRPHWFCQYRKRSEVAAYEREHWDVMRRIEERLAATDDDRLFHLGIVFDPRTWERGYDWTRDVYTEHPRRTPLPAQVWIRTTALGIEPISPKRKRK